MLRPLPTTDLPATDRPPPGPPARDRLSREHYEPRRVPPEVAARSSAPDTLAVGSPAKVGILDLRFERAGERTDLVRRYQKTPLQLMRPLHFDPCMPGMAFPFVMATGGGIAQADRYRMDLHCGPGTEVHLTTQAATKVYRMEHDYATQQVHLTVESGAYVEYLPDPLIPFAGSRLYQETRVTVAEDATVVLGETITAGRLARGERHQYDVLASDLEVRRPDGTLLMVDTLRLEPPSAADGDSTGGRRRGALGPGVLSGHDHVTSFFVITGRRPAAEVADTLHAALHSHTPDVLYGVSVLPRDCGAWVRVLGDSPPRIADAQLAAWDAVRRLLTGTPAPDMHKP